MVRNQESWVRFVLVTVGHQGSPSEASCLWPSGLEAEPETRIQMPMTCVRGGRALGGRECGKHAEEEVAKPDCVSGDDLGLIHRCSGCNSHHSRALPEEGAGLWSLHELLATITCRHLRERCSRQPELVSRGHRQEPSSLLPSSRWRGWVRAVISSIYRIKQA